MRITFTKRKRYRNMQMTVNRAQLVTAITEKRAEIHADHQVEVDAAQAQVDKQSGNGTADLLRELADLVEAGHATVGKYDRALLAFERTHEGNTAGAKLPEFPQRGGRDYAEHYQAELDRVVKAQSKATGKYDAALKLLEMSTDETVGIDAGDYHGLLGA